MFPSQRGHELKYYLNKFHFLKNTGPFRNFWLQEKKFPTSNPKCFPPQQTEFLMALKKCYGDNG